MLKKLIKYEWKNTSKMGGIILLAIAGMTLIGVLGIALPISYLSNETITDENGLFATLLIMTVMMSMMLCFFTLVGVSYGLMIYFGVRFYKTMYSEEGYLTHTLPVTPRQLFLSKTLVAGLWYLLVGLGIVLSVGILIGTGFIIPLGGFDGIRRFLAMMPDMLDSVPWADVIHGIIYVLAAMLITPFSTMIMLFGSLTVGQLFNRFRAFMGILVYIGVTFVNSILANIIRLPFALLAAIAGEESALGRFFLFFGSYDMVIIVALGVAVAFYFISQHILKKKLNLE